MEVFNRYLARRILEDLQGKMVFIGGARQVGKTTLAREIIGKTFRTRYLNWDYREDRDIILNARFSPDDELLIFDELHKYGRWKNYLKGLFDKKGKDYRILVTGSSRLDIYRRGGDSLLGRYFYYKLHPFSLTEIVHRGDLPSPFNLEPFGTLNFGEGKRARQKLEELLAFGGFPEPLFTKKDDFLRRWHNMRLERVIKEDIRDIENIRDLSLMQILVDTLPSRVGSLLSTKSVAEDVSVSHKAAASWLDILEAFYYIFRIYPYRKTKIKSLKKMPKLYLCDWSEVKDMSARFENMIASHLVKYADYLYDVLGYRAKVYFLRDVEGREIDFLVTVDEKPWFSVEVKESGKKVSRNLKYFARREVIPYHYQVVLEEGVDYEEGGIRVISAEKFLSAFV